MSDKQRNKALYMQARMATECSQDDWGRLFNLGVLKGQNTVSQKENDKKGVNQAEALAAELLRFMQSQGYNVKNAQFDEDGNLIDIPKSRNRRPSYKIALALTNDYVKKPDNRTGGNLHMVLSNNNIDDEDIKYCFEQAREQGDMDGIALAEALLQLSKTQRLKVCNSWS